MEDSTKKSKAPRPTAAVTIKDIAAMAGVSPSTVSHYLNHREHKMSADTLEKVRRVIEETNYVSNMGGRMLGRNGSKIIGVIMTYARRNERNAIQDPFFSEIIGALEQEIRTHGYFMMLYISADVEESLRMAAAWNVEGLIVLGSSADDCTCFVQGTTTPVVFIDSYFHDDGFPYINVGLHDRRGGYMMARHLLDMGHRRIAFIADAEVPVGVDYERLEGCKSALTEVGLPFACEDYVQISHRHDQRHEQLRAFAHGRMKAYTALFFASDFYAVDAVNLMFEENISVPEDISIVGFDDNIFAVQCRPKLTTMRQDVSQKAAYAVAQMLRILAHETIDPTDIRLSVSLRVRDSVAKLR